MPIMMTGGYFPSAYDDSESLVDKARTALKDVDYDTMVGTGLSGALVIPILAKALDKMFLIIRKEGENNHSHLPAEGQLGERWIFVDDFISSGSTRDRVIKVVNYIVRNNGLHTTELVGQYLYNRGIDGYTPEDWNYNRTSL